MSLPDKVTIGFVAGFALLSIMMNGGIPGTCRVDGMTKMAAVCVATNKLWRNQ